MIPRLSEGRMQFTIGWLMGIVCLAGAYVFAHTQSWRAFAHVIFFYGVMLVGAKMHLTKFCGKCGAINQRLNLSSTPRLWLCSKCGAELHPESKSHPDLKE